MPRRGDTTMMGYRRRNQYGACTPCSGCENIIMRLIVLTMVRIVVGHRPVVHCINIFNEFIQFMSLSILIIEKVGTLRFFILLNTE